MLQTVRLARGYTQSHLASAAHISQALLSKLETGMVPLDDARLDSLARELNAPKELLTLPASEAGASSYVFHRKRSNLPVSKANQLRSWLDLLHLQVHGILGDGPPVLVTKSPLPDDGYVSPEEIAAEVRTQLGFASGPTRDLVQRLEASGVAVVRRSLGSNRIDALCSWPPGQRPIVLLADHAPGDRQRFTVAHELAHAVLHDVPSEAQESEADRFAAEFLMPRADIGPALERVTVPRLARLKGEWGVSMAALLRRARDLNKISEFQYRQINIEFSRAGYRTREPIEVLIDEPRLIKTAIAGRLAAGETLESLANCALMTTGEFQAVYLKGAV